MERQNLVNLEEYQAEEVIRMVCEYVISIETQGKEVKVNTLYALMSVNIDERMGEIGDIYNEVCAGIVEELGATPVEGEEVHGEVLFTGKRWRASEIEAGLKTAGTEVLDKIFLHKGGLAKVINLMEKAIGDKEEVLKGRICDGNRETLTDSVGGIVLQCNRKVDGVCGLNSQECPFGDVIEKTS
jgi:hypothetical protein